MKSKTLNKYFFQELGMVVRRWSLTYNPFHKRIFYYYEGNPMSIIEGVNHLRRTIKYIKSNPELYEKFSSNSTP